MATILTVISPTAENYFAKLLKVESEKRERPIFRKCQKRNARGNNDCPCFHRYANWAKAVPAWSESMTANGVRL